MAPPSTCERIVSNLGNVLGSQWKYTEAEAIHRRDLKASEQVLRREHPDTLSSVSNLGNVLFFQGKYEKGKNDVSTGTRRIDRGDWTYTSYPKPVTSLDIL
ncbi:hypothetical protein N7448_005442 [Penicillium atrosanguineum]|nr:hypothetical protein N7526_008307 [Penicillium atrosanguineum]KAJ5136888.1 hypothetical protein N7448_005442 [Penicillium atrosanguineum]